MVDVAGKQVSDLVAFVAADHAERFSQGNTRKLNGTVKIITRTLYSIRCRPLLKTTENT